MPTSPGPLPTALATLWERLRGAIPELPPAVITVSPTPQRLDHGPERLSTEADGTVLGVVIGADVLSEGAEATVRAALHEAAHLLAWKRGLKDTTMRGVYHNGTYLAVAEEIGLYWPADRERRQGRGYDNPELSEEARLRHSDDIAALSGAIPDALRHLVVPAAPARAQDRLSMACQCEPDPRKIRVSKTVAEAGPIICGVCGQPFTVA